MAESRKSGRSDELIGRRVVLRPLHAEDYEAWSEVRTRCRNWLIKWEPRPANSAYPIEDRASFSSRCSIRERERQFGTAYGFGIFVGKRFAGEINLSSIQRGAFQNGYLGYWIDEELAGHGYVPESCVAVFAHAFDVLGLHRIQIAIVPRNSASRNVARKLHLRAEGIAVRYLEIDGRWEDHMRYAITSEEWSEQGASYLKEWIE